MSATKGQVITTFQDYFTTIKTYNSAPDWQKDLLLRGTLLQQCNEIEPLSIRQRLRHFWTREAARRGLKIEELKTWV